jgi:prolyl oligopeptidase
MSLLGCLAFGAVAVAGAIVRRVPERPPATRIDPVTEVLHGQPVVDDYRWLEGENTADGTGRVTPEVAAWTDAQNAYTRAVLDQLPGRAALEARLRPLLEVGAVTAPIVRGSRYFFTKRTGSENQPIVYWREGPEGADRRLIDPSGIDPTGLTTVEWFSPSPDGRRLAFGTYRSGDENTRLQLLDVDSGRRLPLEVRNKVQAPDWLPDGSGFVYQNLREPNDPYSGQVCFHRLDTDPTHDPVLFRQFTADEDAALATTWGPFASLSRDGRWLLLGYWIDTVSTDVWLVDFAAFLETGVVDRKVVSVGVAGQASGTVIDGLLYLQTTKGAPRGRLIVVAAGEPAQANWRDLVPERPAAVLEQVSFARDRIAVTWLDRASNMVEVFDYSGRSCGTLAQPGIGSAAVSAELDRTEAFLTFTSFNYPTTIVRVDLSAPGVPGSVWARPDAPVDPSVVTVEQVWYRSRDGTPVSMFLVHRKGLARTGSLPTLLFGYGGFNISETPSFIPHLFQWYEDGGVFALPNLRGGGEYGDAWHESGTRDRKQNTFDDFFAAAEWLIAEGYTQPGRLAIWGGSNGGLLTGAAITQRPELFRAALVLVPLLDMLRYHHFLMARYWVPEYGSAEQADPYAWLAAYSPYHHVTAGTAYPAVLLTAGEHDTRVHALHARKMAARLQAATASDPADRPILLWVDRDAGHGQGKPLHLQLRDRVDQRLFVMWQLGMLE